MNAQADALRERAVKRAVPDSGLHGKPALSALATPTSKNGLGEPGRAGLSEPRRGSFTFATMMFFDQKPSAKVAI